MMRKFGSQEVFDSVIRSQNLPGRGAEVGLDALGFVQDNLSLRVQSDTTDSHRLVIFIAREFGLEASEKFYAGINKKHFTEAGVLNDKTMLLSVAETVGCSAATCSSFLTSTKGVTAIRAAADKVHDLGVNGIPTLVVNARHLLNGAAKADEVVGSLRRVVEDVLKGRESANDRVFGYLWDAIVEE